MKLLHSLKDHIRHNLIKGQREQTFKKKVPSCCKNGSQDEGPRASVLGVLAPKPVEEAMLEAATAIGLFGSK